MERPPSPIIVEGEEEYEVEAILRHKDKAAWRLYHVLWKGYPILNRTSKILLWSCKRTLHHVTTIERRSQWWDRGGQKTN